MTKRLNKSNDKRTTRGEYASALLGKMIIAGFLLFECFHAFPTNMYFALSTLHVLTTFILLYSLAAARTLFNSQTLQFVISQLVILEVFAIISFMGLFAFIAIPFSTQLALEMSVSFAFRA